MAGLPRTPQTVIDWIYSILDALDRILADEGLDYVAMDGTLLGAVRHGGLIPWDDDADLFMLRGEADRLFAGRERLAGLGLGMAPWWYGYKVFPLSGTAWAGEADSPVRYPSVDIFTTEREGDRLVLTSAKARAMWPAEYLTAAEWAGRTRMPFADTMLVLPHPDHAPAILDRLYGPNWRTVVFQVWDHTTDRPADRRETALPSAEPARRLRHPIDPASLAAIAKEFPR